MAHRVSWIPTVVSLVMFALPAPASATHVVVPDNFPTIQAAINSGADVIDVRDGLPPERLTVSGAVTIEPAAGISYVSIPGWFALPQIQSLEIVPGGPDVSLHVRGVRFLGQVRNDQLDGDLDFEACRFDSGLVSFPYNTIYLHTSIRGCMFLGDITIAGYVQFNSNTLIGATAHIWDDGVVDIRNNYVQGPAKQGLDLDMEEARGYVSHNTIRGTVDGIHFKSTEAIEVSHNDISDCSRHGIVYEEGMGGISCDSNLVQRCGGSGIIALTCSAAPTRSAFFSGNVIRNTGQTAIDFSRAFVSDSRGNQVLDAGGDGIRAWGAAGLEGNVVGRCQGNGIVVVGEALSVNGNTLFANSGTGIELAGDVYDGGEVRNNLSAFNSGAGIHLTDLHSSDFTMGCNDWFGNAGGATSGLAPAATDLQVDPLFCSLSGGDVHLASNSPLLAAPGCGLIGALGQGCGATAAVAPATESAPARFRVWPVPSRGVIGFELPRSASASRIELFDVTGARYWSKSVPAGAGRLEWDGRGDDGHAVSAGVYFAHLTQGNVSLGTVRVVLAK